MGADDVRPGAHHLPGLVGVEDKGQGQQPAVVGKADGLHLLLVAEALLLQRLPEAPVDHADGGVVDDAGKTRVPDPADVLVHLLGGVGGVETEEHGRRVRVAQQLRPGVFHDHVVAVGIAQKARQRAHAHGAVFPAAERQQQIAAAQHRVLGGDAAAGGHADQMLSRPDLFPQPFQVEGRFCL